MEVNEDNVVSKSDNLIDQNKTFFIKIQMQSSFYSQNIVISCVTM